MVAEVGLVDLGLAVLLGLPSVKLGSLCNSVQDNDARKYILPQSIRIN